MIKSFKTHIVEEAALLEEDITRFAHELHMQADNTTYTLRDPLSYARGFEKKADKLIEEAKAMGLKDVVSIVEDAKKKFKKIALDLEDARTTSSKLMNELARVKTKVKVAKAQRK